MDQLTYLIKKMKLHVLSVGEVPESFSSTVYRLELSNQETVFLKIPYTKEKLIREVEALEAVKETVSVPDVLDYWEGNEEMTGALLLSCVQGQLTHYWKKIINL